MQQDIISQIKKLKNISDVIVLTYNIDFIFLQTVFVSALKKCGYPNLTILADAQCAINSFNTQSSVITGLGTRYRVIPVSMSPGFRFHPKAILLSGQDTAHLFVGSGNMTFGGIRENAEIWSRFDISDAGNGEFSAFQQYLNSITPFVGFPDEVEKDIAESFEVSNHPWASLLGDASGLWYSPGNSQSLKQVIVDTISGISIDKLIICTPYFDKEARALKQLCIDLGSPLTEVYIQSNKSTLFKGAAEKLPGNISIKNIQAKKGEEASNRFIHAKWYAIESGDVIHLFHGSANCSNAALINVQPHSNAELMIISKYEKAAFEEHILSELVVDDKPPELVECIEESDSESKQFLIIRSARYEYGLLKISYIIPDTVKVTSLMVDGESIDYEMFGQNELVVKLTDYPKSVYLVGVSGKELVESNYMWVDDESSLRSNSSSRSIIETIHDAQSGNGHDPRKWFLIFNLLNKNLAQMNSREIRGAAQDTSNNPINSIKVNKEQLTSNSYSNLHALPILHRFGSGSTTSIYSLLLQSFGITNHASTNVESSNESTETVANPDEEVDRPDSIPSVQKKETILDKPTSKEIEKLTTSAKQIVERICEPEYLSIRDPQRLSLDIQVVGLLLRKAYSMGWVDKQVYFDLTHKVWSYLFFHSDDANGAGWLQTRFEAEPDHERFISLFVSPMLTASLYAWFSAVPIESGNIYSQRFLLSQIMAMGRCPWLWLSDEKQNKQVAEDLLKIWNDSPCGSDKTFSDFAVEINDSAKIGVALIDMEEELAKFDISEIRNHVYSDGVTSGDVLWQGKKGICIALDDSAVSDRIKVLCLQDPDKVSVFVSSFLIPIRSLLESNTLLSKTFLQKNKEILSKFISSI